MTRWAALTAVVALAGCASQGGGSAVGASAPVGYLTAADLARLTLPPAPEAGSSVDLADRATSEGYRALENGDRWLLATAHAELRAALAMPHFDCALGTRLGAAETPRLTALFARLMRDADAAAARAGSRTFRARPVLDDPDRAACRRLTESGRATASYPSGTAAVGAAYAEAMAALAPDRAGQARRIGREIAVSGVICGLHYPSDAVAGEALGRAVFREVALDPAFQADLDVARAEMAVARASGLTNPGCAAERAALAAPLP